MEMDRLGKPSAFGRTRPASEKGSRGTRIRVTSVAAAADARSTRAAFHAVFPGVMLAMFLASVDQTILAAALPAMAASFNGLADISWVAVAYLLSATIAAPLYGQLGDCFGRRALLMVALGVFLFASAACAAAPTLSLLIAARALQGLGGGGLMTLSQALIGEHVAPRERARFQGYFGALFALSSTIGPVLGAYLTEHLSWRAVFAVNLPLGVVAALLAARIPHSPPAKARVFRFDIVGAAVFAIAAGALLYAFGSVHRFGWRSGPMLALTAIAALACAGLVWWERRTLDPVIAVRLLGIPAIWRSNAVVFCFAAALFASILYLPMYLQLDRGFGIGESGLLLLPITLTIAASATVTGRLITKTGRLTLYPTVGLALSSAAYCALALTVSYVPTAIVLALMMTAAWGLGSVMPATQIIVQDTAGSGQLGSATASVAVSRSLGAAIGAAVAGSVLLAVLGHQDPALAHLLQGAALQAENVLGAQAMQQSATVTAELDAAFRAVFVLLAVLTALGALIAHWVPRRSL